MSRRIRGVVRTVALICASAGGVSSAFAFEFPAANSPYTDSQSTDSYTSDPSESYAVEVPDSQISDAEPARVAPSHPSCRAFYPAVAGEGSRATNGTLCEQSDGSLRMVTAPGGDVRISERASGYCREYQQTLDASDEERIGHGTVCWQSDGSWRVVMPAHADGSTAPPVEVFERAYSAGEPYQPFSSRSPVFEDEAPRVAPPPYRAPSDPYPPAPRERNLPTREAPLRSVRDYPESSALPQTYAQNRPALRSHRWFAWRREANGKHRGHDRYEND